MDLKKIEEKLSKDIEKIGYHLYSLKYKKKDKILEILLDETLDLDQISKVSEKISKFMDKYDDELEDYLLDIASAGCEREISNEKELIKAIKKYIHIETKDKKVDGTLIEYKDNKLKVEYLDKTRKKILEIYYSDVKKMRYAVNFKGEK